MAVTDSKQHVITQAEAFGEPQEHDLLGPMIQGVREKFQAIGKEEDIFEKAKLTTDSGFHTEKNMEMLAVERIDAYVADNRFQEARSPIRRLREI